MITGFSGFVGRELIKKLSEQKNNFEFILIKRNKTYFSTQNIKNSKIINWNIEENKRLNEKIDTIIHLAGETKNLNKIWPSNFTGTKNIVDLAIDKGVKNIIFLSSVSVYEKNKKEVVTENNLKKPKTLYGKSKKYAEEYLEKKCKSYNINFVILRPTDIFGCRPPFLPFLSLIKSVKNGHFVFIGDFKKTILNYIPIENIAECIIYFLNNDFKISNYILNDPVDLKKTIDLIAQTLGTKVPSKHIKYSSGRTLGLLCDKINIFSKINLPFNKNSLEELTNTTKYQGTRILNDSNYNYNYKTLVTIKNLTKYYLKNNLI